MPRAGTMSRPALVSRNPSAENRCMAGPEIATVDRSRLVDWMMDCDPSLRWQVMDGLLGASVSSVSVERSRIATEGWGKALLERQDPDGGWAGALYSPKWTSTTYTLLLLERLGLPGDNPQARAAGELLWRSGRFFDGGLTLAKSIQEPETCITGMFIKLAAAFGVQDQRIEPTVDWLVGQQLDDGGWNCESIRSGATHGSVHTTITVLEALASHREAGGRRPVDGAMARGIEFFLVHRLYRSHRTGELMNPAFTRFPFPPQWHFDIVRGLEFFRSIDFERDQRLGDAIEVVRKGQRRDGTWRKHRPYPGRYWFQLEPQGPSRWSTLRALRVLDWWDR